MTRKCEKISKKEWANATNGHTLLRSGNIVWCSLCGAFAETRANRLQKVCLKKPPDQYGSGGVRSQLNRLRAGLHPVTRCRLPQTTWADGTARSTTHGYLRKAGAVELVDDKFVEYVTDEARTLLVPIGGRSASDKRKLLRGRILLKAASAVRREKKARTSLTNRRADELAKSFVDAISAEGDPVGVSGEDACDAMDQSCADFWNGLELMGVDRLHGIPDKPDRFSRGLKQPSRTSRLMSNVALGCNSCRGSMACRCSRPAMH